MTSEQISPSAIGQMREAIRLLATADVAALLSISSRTICLWAECGELPALKIGRQWRFDKHAIERWMEKKAPFA